MIYELSNSFVRKFHCLQSFIGIRRTPSRRFRFSASFDLEERTPAAANFYGTPGHGGPGAQRSLITIFDSGSNVVNGEGALLDATSGNSGPFRFYDPVTDTSNTVFLYAQSTLENIVTGATTDPNAFTSEIGANVVHLITSQGYNTGNTPTAFLNEFSDYSHFTEVTSNGALVWNFVDPTATNPDVEINVTFSIDYSPPSTNTGIMDAVRLNLNSSFIAATIGEDQNLNVTVPPAPGDDFPTTLYSGAIPTTPQTYSFNTFIPRQQTNIFIDYTSSYWNGGMTIGSNSNTLSSSHLIYSLHFTIVNP